MRRNTQQQEYHFYRKPSAIAVAVGLAWSMPTLADDYTNQPIERLQVLGQQPEHHSTLGAVDTLLTQQGVDFSAAGGMSALPVLNGMMGDRVKVLIDGSDVTASCANQMNPPLSYISANQVATVDVVAGVSPVSAGGDNIAGVIKVSSVNPIFADSDTLQWQSGYVSAGYHSVNDAMLLGAGVKLSSNSVSVDYQGAYEDANSYRDGHGDKVLDTLYRAQNHALTAAWRDQTQQFAVKLTHQNIPFQGFANQYMDMTDNHSYGVLARYQRQLADDGEFSAQANWHSVSHKMGFFSPEKTGMMPMNTDGDDYSYQLHWRLPVSAKDTLLLGQETYDYRLDDEWPAVVGSSMMGPNNYININDGRRLRAAVFGEWQQQSTTRWWWSAGVRYEYVTTNAGDVQAYNTMAMMGMINADAAAASAFNATDRKRSDNLLDVTLLARYQLTTGQQLQLGLARKNRAPNLYERYSWGRGTMAATMIGWFGDGNGYVGDITLKPETADTLSFAYKAFADDWQLAATVWYTKVTDYIDADVIGSFNKSGLANGQRNLLQFTNLDATLYGGSVSSVYRLADNYTGLWQLNASVSATHGERDDGGQPLYQIKPWQTELALQQQLGDWQNSIAWQWVAAKDRVDISRLENATAAYSLLNISSRLQWQGVTLTFAVNNLLDHNYELPLGGVSIAEYKADSSQGFPQLAGAGRSLEFGVSCAF
ncbi:TonB-dependent receptor [Shewanella fodinae]|uniref:TonB-dependent receptor n=1 Tax=Shewanella fodinae TaxID=552357 RepID=UPI001E4F2984|nr:TonB-dependent receptor [Shewanella fodinae]MCL2904955.1 TonB-dependent receptor [Shewanella fodinae]